MVTFRRFTVGFFIILLSLNLWNILTGKTPGGFYHTHAALLYIVLLVSYFGVSFAMAFIPCSNFHHKVICRGKTTEKYVSVTFDDGPDPLKTPAVLDILRKHDVLGTFFCIGSKMAGNETLIRQMHASGHLLGNHSYSHSKWFDLFSAHKIRAELIETDRVIARIIGRSPLFFRPPYGVINPMVSNALKKMSWKVVCWNIRSLDTLRNDPHKTHRNIMKNLAPGSVILLHDHSAFTEFHLDDLLTGIREAGFKIVPLDLLLEEPAYAA